MNSFTGIIHHRLKPPHAPPPPPVLTQAPPPPLPPMFSSSVGNPGGWGGLPAMTKHQNFKFYQKVTEGQLNRKDYYLFGYDKSKNNLLLENMEEKI